jgi:hypothetical protein
MSVGNMMEGILEGNDPYPPNSETVASSLEGEEN